jgi:uncharacterized protein (TIGR02145 family)
MIRILFLMMLPFVCFSQITPREDIQVNSKLIEKENLDTKRKASYNLDEIKVRWKKAALENCTGVPCIVTPPAPPAPSFTCGTSTVTDVDLNTYNTVLIGTQCWTKENLRVTKYRDGTTIPDETSGTWSTLATGARTDYTGATGIPSGQTYVSTYGYLYNWYAAAGIITNGGSPTKNICPDGWHVPTDAEWTTLETYLNTSVGDKMKKNDALWSTNTGTNTSGFSALPGGYRGSNGSFLGIRSLASFWSATENNSNSNNAWYRGLNGSNSSVSRFDFSKKLGASVRCLRD